MPKFEALKAVWAARKEQRKFGSVRGAAASDWKKTPRPLGASSTQVALWDALGSAYDTFGESTGTVRYPCVL